MWSSKMAARWSRKDGDLNAGNNHSLSGNTPSESVLCGVEDVAVDTRTCVDHSILAIFEDATGSSEDKNGAEEESETLLSALTEMLDSVEDDDGMTMSPFDTLPETSLLTHSEQRDNSGEFSLADRLRPRSKPSNITFTVNSGAEKDDQSETGKRSPPQLFKNPRVEPEVEVFTSQSLVNLVKIMHSYCLKLHVEEERDRAFFTQEEVWKYERPSEECDEEINVVSDDEVTVKEERDKTGEARKLLKSALVSRNSSREKKKVSFGPVQVASFNESVERQEKQLASGLTAEEHGTKELESPPGLDTEPPSPASTAEALPPKTKSLSLQEYRQLRRKRQPLVEKQGNYNTKWPSVSEPPKELTPILCLQQQRQNSCAPKTTYVHPDSRRRPPPPETKPSTALWRSGPKRPRSESIILSPASPLPGSTADPNVSFPECKRSPTKKAVLLSSDPPNPVLLPLPVSQASSPSTDPSVEFVSAGFGRTSHSQSILCESSGPSPQHQLSTVEAGDRSRDCSMSSEEFSALGVSCISPESQSKDQEPKTSLLPSGVEASVPVKEMMVPSKSQAEASWQSSAADSGIEAPDLTSLLEQFEETQAKEKRGELPVGPLKPSSTSDFPGPQKTLRNPQLLQMSEGEDIPEPLGTEIILSTQQDLPARRKAAPSKTIQIIDPRPLPSKKTHSSVSEPPVALPSPHLCSSISSDHDYCGPVDRSAASTSQRSSSRASKLKEVSKSTDEVPVTTHSSDPDPAEPKQQTSTTTITDVNKPMMQNLAEDSCCSSDMIPSPSHRSVPEPGCGLEGRMVPCTLPTPPPSPPTRGRDKRSYRSRSHRSDSSSSSCSSTSSSSSSSSSASRSPKRQKRRHKRSESSSSSSSRSRSVSRSPPRRYRWQYSRSMSSRSRSRSLSKSRSSSRSRSPASQVCRQRWRNVCSSRESRRLRREQEIRIQKLKAIDERRVVYVGRICRSMTHDELRERFAQFGEVECVSLHFRERGDHYGFVTFYNMSDAFAAIDNGGKLRRPDELPFDLCFGGRRQFCSSDYADLDADRDPDPGPAKSRFEDLDFDQLLKQAQRGLKR